MPQPDHIHALPVPEREALDPDLQKYMRICEEKLGLVPNVIRAYTFRPQRLRNFIATYPAHPLASSAFYWLGEIYYDRADYQRAAETYAAGYANYPTGYKAADTLLKLGLSLLALNRTADACTTLNQLRVGFPSAPINIQQRADAARASAGCN